MLQQHQLVELTADVVSAFVGNNQVRATELAGLIASVHASIAGITAEKPIDAAPVAPTAAVSVRKSITDDYLICLDDGKKFKSLRRHLGSLGMTPDDYRAKWGLPKDYPMTAPGYAAKRSELAKASGLGSSRKKAAAVVAAAPPASDPVPAAPPVETPAKRRGRPPKQKAA